MSVRTTAYTHTEPGGSNNAIGTRLHYGGSEYSAASDWSWMPLGTRFRMLETGRTYVIEDYGSALVGRKTIDLYMPTRAQMRSWGVRQVQIDILTWGSKAMSLKLLAPRARHEHVARMCAQLRKDGVQPIMQAKKEDGPLKSIPKNSPTQARASLASAQSASRL
jgi:3D (Asp-Asp-Asp) domain-containing protein